MAKRFTDTEIWDKEWFMSLTPKEKCLVKFIFDKCDVAGFWSPNWILASAYIGEKVSATDLKNFESRLEFIGSKIFVKDFVSFQYGTLSEACKPHIKIIAILKNYNLYERVCIGYPYPMERVQEKDKDKEEEKDKEKEGKKVKPKKQFVPPTLAEVREYFREKGYSELIANKAFEYYETAGWKDSSGSQVMNWKQKMIGVWFKDENKTGFPASAKSRVDANGELYQKSARELQDEKNLYENIG